MGKNPTEMGIPKYLLSVRRVRSFSLFTLSEIVRRIFSKLLIEIQLLAGWLGKPCLQLGIYENEKKGLVIKSYELNKSISKFRRTMDQNRWFMSPQFYRVGLKVYLWLTLYQTSPGFNDPWKDALRKHCGEKRRRCFYPAFSLCSHNAFFSYL